MINYIFFFLNLTISVIDMPADTNFSKTIIVYTYWFPDVQHGHNKKTVARITNIRRVFFTRYNNNIIM